jgi:hypothetical protein
MQHVAAQQPSDQDWDRLIAGVRSGDPEMCFGLQERLKPGIWVLLARKSLKADGTAALQAVLSSVVGAIRRGEIAGAAELARATRLAIAEHVAPRRAAATAAEEANPVLALNTHLSDRERDMLRRFYVLAEAPADICRALGVSMDEFKRAKSLARAAVAVTLAARRQTATTSSGVTA